MPAMFVGRRRLLLGMLALLGIVQAVLSVAVAVLTPRILTGLGGTGLALGLIIAALVIGGARIIERVVSEELGQDYVRQMRKLLITSALAPDKEVSLGITIARTTNDLTAVKNWVSMGVSPIVVGVPMIGGIVIGMFVLVPQMALVIVGTLAVFALLMWMLSGRFLVKAAELRKVRGTMASYITDTVTAGQSIRYSGGVKREVNRIDQYSAKVQEASRGRALVSGTMRGSAASITTVLSVLVAIVGAQVGSTGATVTTAIFIAGLLAAPITDLGRVGEYRQNFKAAERILLPVIANANAYEQREKRQRKARKRMKYLGNPAGLARGAVHVADIRDNAGMVPELVAAPGARVLIAGRSTSRIDRVIQELVADRPFPDAWVSVAGKHLYAMPAQDTRELVGVAARDVPLEHGSISRVIRYRTPNTDMSVSEILARVGLRSHVESLPKKTATMLRRGGEPLATPQRALVKIARAIAGDPPLLVLNQVDDQLDVEGKMILRRIIAEYPGVVIVRSSNPVAIMDRYDVWNVDELAPALVLAEPVNLQKSRWSTVAVGAGVDPFGPAVRRSALDAHTHRETAEQLDDEEDGE